ncbi:hypothetical protein [Porphyrobacter sp. AAP60]|uniref:hypothetical protein n=1 Tax=Porphyrobacter sp. AAP60 TaxID=1523423 RepID=UPI0006B886A6|nr:hypothetical protein [Porphyrobacter sp. AAP60]KPF64256.1 hypothetical protein IP79_05845 [Porphyrobacter sp. AAP60]
MNSFNDTANVTGMLADPVSTADESALAAALERDAAMFVSRPKSSGPEQHRPLRLIVCDFEYAYDRSAYAGYTVSEGKGGRTDLRWPFHRVAAASWMVLRFDPQADLPAIEECVVIANDEADEQGLVSRFFDALSQYPDAICTTWAGEFKDLAVLRKCAGELGLQLPHQLRDLNPYAYARLDLCQAVTGKAKPVHLPEYAMGTHIPCKPSPSKDIGPLVEKGKWLEVRDQCLADVLTTCVVALRHLHAQGVIACHPPRSLEVLAEAAGRAVPASRFVRNSFAPWSRDQVAASKLKGVVHRAE